MKFNQKEYAVKYGYAVRGSCPAVRLIEVKITWHEKLMTRLYGLYFDFEIALLLALSLTFFKYAAIGHF